jgi:hypothetical protein
MGENEQIFQQLYNRIASITGEQASTVTHSNATIIRTLMLKYQSSMQIDWAPQLSSGRNALNAFQRG